MIIVVDWIATMPIFVEKLQNFAKISHVQIIIFVKINIVYLDAQKFILSKGELNSLKKFLVTNKELTKILLPFNH